MERSIDPQVLAIALGSQSGLPSPQELSELLIQAEMDILLGRSNVENSLTATAWFLHGIASSRHALEKYGIARQRTAFQVSAHIFDLVMRSSSVTEVEKLKFGFASQIAYIRSRLDPNAIAIYQREFRTVVDSTKPFFDYSSELALIVAIALLGFDTKLVHNVSKRIYSEVSGFARELRSISPLSEIFATQYRNTLDEIYNTPFGAAVGVIEGCRDIATFLLYGRKEKMIEARSKLQQAIENSASQDDHLSRWVAAHILNLGQDLENSSIWFQLPPHTPSSVQKAFVHGSPRVYCLWPPQLDFFQELKLVGSDSKRLFISTPTSGGKTLLSQLMVVSHIAQHRSSVCFVAPTRALCHEVKETLEARLRFLGTEIIDSIAEGELLNGFDTSVIDDPQVEVMTPERLSYLLRTDSSGLLKKFGLFIFDEVHLIGDKTRGWVLEEVLTFLHYVTENSPHRIALISAVIGNKHHFVSWMTNTAQPLFVHSEWRGPRRIHAVWTTGVDWDSGIRSSIRSKEFTHRMHYSQYGELHIFSLHLNKVKKLRTTNAIGDLTLKYRYEKDPEPEKDKVKSTAFYLMIIPLIQHLSSLGSVLVVEGTKPSAIRLAQHIAAGRAAIETNKLQDLIDLVEIRLTFEHPLRDLLSKGIAYHHGSLPAEIRTAIEDAIAQGLIQIVVATTTMTEGINLPVKSVVIASQGAYGNEGYDEYITGSKLINAIGRAGRATRETEGVIVLAWNGSLTDEVYKRLSPSEEDLTVISNLATKQALSELAEFEQNYMVYQDLALEIGSGQVAGFLKFVWFVTAKLDDNTNLIDISDVGNVLSKSLAWQQLEQLNKDRWLKFADQTISNYYQKPPRSRKLWATSGTSVKTASELEAISLGLILDLQIMPAPGNILEWVILILSEERLKQVLEFPEVKRLKLYKRRTSDEFDLDIRAVLESWISGLDLVSISMNYFSEVEDIGYKFEQLGDFINYYFEVTLPWLVGILVAWTNDFLEKQESDLRLPANLPSYIKWGVNSSVALELLVRGIKSRLLAERIAYEWSNQQEIGEVRAWLRSMSLEDWRTKFDASASDLRNLLHFAKKSKGGVAAELIINEKAMISVRTNLVSHTATSALLKKLSDNQFSEIGIWVNEGLVGIIYSGDQYDINDILNLGLDLEITFFAENNKGFLQIELLDPDYDKAD